MHIMIKICTLDDNFDITNEKNTVTQNWLFSRNLFIQ